MTLSRLPPVPAVAAKAVPLFASALAALTFALNFSMPQYDRPLMNKIASGELAAGTTLGGGKGLSGLDGAGRAGMIRAELARLSPIDQAVLVARAAPAQISCGCGIACCAGWKVNPEWQDVTITLTSAAASGALSDCVSNGRLRSALIQRLFGAEVALAELAERYDVDVKTASAHNGKLKRWLFGGADRKGAGLHQLAYRRLSDRLRACQWIPDEDGS